MHYLPSSGENLFQRIKRIVTDYEKENWAGSALNVSVGDPDQTPPRTLQHMLATAGTTNERKIHNYRECDEPTWFCQAMVQHHTGVDITAFSHLRTLPIAGIKTIYWLLPIACGANRTSLPWQGEISEEQRGLPNQCYMRNAPAYDLIGIRSEYLGEDAMIRPIYAHEDFKLKIANIPQNTVPPKLIVTIKPGNPCPVGASREERIAVIEYCSKHKIRLVNDAAYAGLIYKNHVSLTEVAKDYPDLEWIEMFSVSKTMNAAGWRVGAIAWSKDFVDEVQKVKENNDSGVNGPAMVAIASYLQSPESGAELEDIKTLYQKRLQILLPLLQKAWFKQACSTDGWLFTLRHCPTSINGISIQNAEHANQVIIKATGIIGIPFSGSPINGKPEQFVRYSLCAPLEDATFKARFAQALTLLQITY